jgi:hypothetical protein
MLQSAPSTFWSLYEVYEIGVFLLVLYLVGLSLVNGLIALDCALVWRFKWRAIQIEKQADFIPWPCIEKSDGVEMAVLCICYCVNSLNGGLSVLISSYSAYYCNSIAS